jgi:UPF0042 nucleotide-binding protein
MRIILITGISGSGKSVALNVLEDAGTTASTTCRPSSSPISPAIWRIRATHSLVSPPTSAAANRSRDCPIRCELAANHQVQVLYLTASTDALVQRYSERAGATRFRHKSKLARRHAQRYLADRGHRDGAELLSPLAESAHRIDTSNVRTNTLRSWIKELIQDENENSQQLTLLFESFGFKHGVPSDADLVFDVRSLPNPITISRCARSLGAMRQSSTSCRASRWCWPWPRISAPMWRSGCRVSLRTTAAT